MTKYLSTSMLIALGDRREKLVHTSDGILSALLSAIVVDYESLLKLLCFFIEGHI